ncbi:protein of unknown function [Paraburkholderia kururiensis]|uniref:hypothetical protein n=1 Tax=Paraburkholderia kururiensis TaxID=984307 RepID=UPI0039A6E54A
MITKAGRAGNVKGLVYLSAFKPDSGESVLDLLARLEVPMDGMELDGRASSGSAIRSRTGT